MFCMRDLQKYKIDSIFFVSTFYHVVLSHVLACSSSSNGKSVLIMKGGRENFKILYESISEDVNIPFDKVVFLEGSNEERFENCKVLAKNIKHTNNLISELKPRNIYIFKERMFEQSIMKEAKKARATINYVEDGNAVYSDYTKNINSVTNRLIFMFINLRRYNYMKVQGTSSSIENVIVSYPNNVRHELFNKNIIQMPKINDMMFSRLNWPVYFLEKLNIDKKNLECDVLYVLGRVRSFKRKGINNYGSVIRHSIESSVNHGSILAIKYHPQEKLNDPLNVAEFGVNIIPKSIPAELIYFINKNRLKYVYGDTSTSMITAKWFLPDTKVISFMTKLGVNDITLKKLLVEVGVELV